MSSPSSPEGSSPELPLQRPRPRFVVEEERRLSTASGASTPSTSELLSPPTPFSPFGPRNSFGSNGSFANAKRIDSFASFASSSSLANLDSPYVGAGRPLSLGYEYTFPADYKAWASEFTPDFKEDDDDIHTPDPNEKRRRIERDGHLFSWRGLTNLVPLVLLTMAILTLLAGYPMITHFMSHEPSTLGAFNIGGINASGQVPVFATGRFNPIDPDTPQSAYTAQGWRDSSVTYQLVFSDEFNSPGRTFYPGDDPYWEAVDLHYWPTNNLEWYDPAAITTAGGDLVITLEQKDTHGLNYQGGMVTSWNKFCFTGGYVEANVSLPGLNNIAGLWPALWTMGNLGRAGYGASTDGMWPYSYDSCDVGTVANQSINGQPVAATINGDTGKGGVLSYLPGQKLSRCTCPGETHPGPMHSDGTFVGRSAPEIDVFEAQVTDGAPNDVGGVLVGQVSQSAQFAPFDAAYKWNTTAGLIINDPTISIQNTFLGSATQEATSIVTNTNPLCYEDTGRCYSVYGVEYKPGFDDAYITWQSQNKVAWTLLVAGMGPNADTEISARPIPQEPMYLIANLGMSYNFGNIDLAHLPFPVHLHIDYIRVYQPENAVNVGCDPPDFPTAKYINQFIDAYTDPNLTTWRDDFGQEWPKNSWLKQC